MDQVRNAQLVQEARDLTNASLRARQVAGKFAAIGEPGTGGSRKESPKDLQNSWVLGQSPG